MSMNNKVIKNKARQRKVKSYYPGGYLNNSFDCKKSYYY